MDEDTSSYQPPPPYQDVCELPQYPGTSQPAHIDGTQPYAYYAPLPEYKPEPHSCMVQGQGQDMIEGQGVIMIRLPPAGAGQSETPPHANCLYAIIATLCCCCPIGAIAIYYAHLSQLASAVGDYATARARTRMSVIWAHAAVFTGSGCIAMMIAYMYFYG